MADDPTDLLRELVAQCLGRMETEGESALQAICDEHPSHAEVLRRRIRALRGVGLLDSRPPTEGFPERLGEFRLIRPLGGGGMGVVYLAQQESLNRTVALKLIRPEHLYFPGARERFQREVDAVARLRHPGIVPVYTVGEENGVPYFAMEHVEGRSLSEILKDLVGLDPAGLSAADLQRQITPEGENVARPRSGTTSRSAVFQGRWVEACFRVAREVAEALEHAHARGVLHRDVKPSNIMVTPAGRVVLLDFGLAISDGASKLTRSGALIGSLPYMAPEQVDGRLDDIGTATDVYGLGATLYEMLTLQLPHPGETVDEIQRSIQGGRAVAPSKINTAVPWDAETVCLTAIDVEPGRRYVDAAAMGRDLGNVLSLRPIQARRPGMALRGRRFAQRHPALSVAAVLGCAVAIGGPTTFGVLQRAQALEVKGLNERLTVALEIARQTQAASDRDFERALEAVDLMLSEVGQKDLADVPLMATVQRRLLERALEFYQSLLAERSEDLDVRRRTALAWHRVGRIQRSLGDREAAREHLEQATVQLSALATESGGTADQIAALRAANELALFHMEGGDVQPALGVIQPILGSLGATEAALEREGEAGVAWSADPELALTQASSLFCYARLCEAQGNHPIAELAAWRASDHARDLAHLGLESAAAMAAEHYGEAALMLMRRPATYPDRAKDVDRLYEQAFAMLAEVPAERQSAMDFRLSAAMLLQNRAGHERRMDRLEDAEASYREALPQLEQLVTEFPGLVATRRELAHVINNLGLIMEMTDRLDQAEAFYSQGIQRMEELDRAVPGVATIISNTGIGWMNLAVIAKLRGDAQTEAERLVKACAWLERAVQRSPDQQDLRLPWFNALAGQLDAWNRVGDHARAAATARRAPDALPRSWLHQVKGAIYLARAVRTAEHDLDLTPSELEEVRAEYAADGTRLLRRAVDLGFTNTADLPTHEDFVPFHGVEEFETFLAELGLK